MSYDIKCVELARHFLGDLASDRLVDQLAQEIQTTVEDWITLERDKLGKALGIDGEPK